MNKTLIATAVFAVLAGSAVPARANDYTNNRSGASKQEIRKDRVKAATAVQKQEYLKEWVDLSQKQYAKALKDWGPENELTEDAKDRHAKAVAAYDDARKDAGDARQELRKDLNN